MSIVISMFDDVRRRLFGGWQRCLCFCVYIEIRGRRLMMMMMETFLVLRVSWVFNETKKERKIGNFLKHIFLGASAYKFRLNSFIFFSIIIINGCFFKKKQRSL